MSSDISTPSLLAENFREGLPNFAQSTFPSVVSVAKLPPKPRPRAKEKEKELVQMNCSSAVNQSSTTTISTIGVEETETLPSLPPDPAGTAMAKTGRKRKVGVPLPTEVDSSPALKRTRRTRSQTELTSTGVRASKPLTTDTDQPVTGGESQPRRSLAEGEPSNCQTPPLPKY